MKVLHQMIYDVLRVLAESAIILPRTKAIDLHLDSTTSMRRKEFQERRNMLFLKCEEQVVF